MHYKTTKSLFRGIYQYKIVLICAGAHYFRNGDMKSTLEELMKIDLLKAAKIPTNSYSVSTKIRTAVDLDYALALQAALSRMLDLELRVESPWISIYTNNRKDIDVLAKLDVDKVKYISAPSANNVLTSNTVIMPKTNYDFRVTLGKTTNEHSAFISWAETNKKLKLTKSCIRDLKKDRSWGGTHFYVTGDNNLLMAKMHLGGCIAKVERIIKA